MTDLHGAAGAAPAAASTHSGRDLRLPGWSGNLNSERVERDQVMCQARGSAAGRQLQRCFPRWEQAFEHLSWRALVGLARNEPVDPNDRDLWRTTDEHAQAVLRRHGITLNPRHLTLAAVGGLIDGQARADRDAGLDWTRIAAPASRLDEKLRRAHAEVPVDLADPAVFGDVAAQRRALATQLGLPTGQADDLSRWVLAHPDQFDPAQLRSWRIASPTWLQMAGEQLDAVGRVERPVALFVMPAGRGDGWQLTPVLSLDAIRQGGREAYRRLLDVLRELKTLEAGSELFKRALAELSRAQGVVLGNVGTFVTASCDPAALLNSKAMLAKALVRQGLVEEAMRGGGDGLPLLRGKVAQTLAGVASEEQALVFCDRVWCLRYLAATLRDRHGIDARVADGTMRTSEFEELKREFSAGELPILCLSPIGQEGHNLQAASVLLHLDLPWVPTGLEQRVGRAARPGSARGWVQTYIPYIRGGGIEHVVSILSPRGGEHHQILDSFEGVRAAQSTIATQLAEITGQVGDAKDHNGFAASAARLRVAASVFGG
ncbi:MAG TPA: helicase-related protein [Solirubrobacteraceae bacterium]|nr:helicase-related protein [Solirubrobacteraceae bacterium]